MSKIIDAIYENGVFRPIQNVKVKEHEKVALKIISLDEWQNRFDRIIKKYTKNLSAILLKKLNLTFHSP